MWLHPTLNSGAGSCELVQRLEIVRPQGEEINKICIHTLLRGR